MARVLSPDSLIPLSPPVPIERRCYPLAHMRLHALFSDGVSDPFVNDVAHEVKGGEEMAPRIGRRTEKFLRIRSTIRQCDWVQALQGGQNTSVAMRKSNWDAQHLLSR